MKAQQYFTAHFVCGAAAILSMEPDDQVLGAIDPILNVVLTRDSHSLVVNWTTFQGVPYQVEAASNLIDWTNISPVLIGNGSRLSFTNSAIGKSREFYRVSRLFPASPGSAQLEPGIGLLTIVADTVHSVISVANDGSGTIVVNSGALPVAGGPATLANTRLIQELGSATNDQTTIGSGLPPAHLFGADGDDTILGGDANETIIGGAGNDLVSGGRGNDLVLLGDGNDTFSWNPGDASDVVEGQGGTNTLVFNCANVAEPINLSANGSRLRFTRDVANVVMDANGIHTVNIQALGGADSVTINTLAGTDVTQVNVDLAATGGAGDAAADTVTVNGTAAPDLINIIAGSGLVRVTGLSAQVQIAHPEPSIDTLIINGLGSNDTFNVDPGVAGLIQLITNQ